MSTLSIVLRGKIFKLGILTEIKCQIKSFIEIQAWALTYIGLTFNEVEYIFVQDLAHYKTALVRFYDGFLFEYVTHFTSFPDQLPP